MTGFKKENYIYIKDDNESKSSEDTSDTQLSNVPKTENKEFKGMFEITKLQLKENERNENEEEILYISTQKASKYGEKSYNPSSEQDIFEGLMIPEIVDESNCKECCKKCTIF